TPAARPFRRSSRAGNARRQAGSVHRGGQRRTRAVSRQIVVSDSYVKQTAMGFARAETSKKRFFGRKTEEITAGGSLGPARCQDGSGPDDAIGLSRRSRFR